MVLATKVIGIAAVKSGADEHADDGADNKAGRSTVQFCATLFSQGAFLIARLSAKSCFPKLEKIMRILQVLCVLRSRRAKKAWEF